LTEFVGKENAARIMESRLADSKSTADSFAPDHYKLVLNRIVAASAMWIGDATKKAELVSKLQSLA
jgi:hypothetical protein